MKHLTFWFGLSALALLVLAAGAPAEAARQPEACAGCQVFEESCTANCSALDDPLEARTCLLACAKAAATCSCDEKITLTSEELVERGWVPGPSLTEAACHSTTPCPLEYSSCAGWSAYSNCGELFCGTYKFCGDPPFCYEPDLCFGPALRQRQERFRVCFNSSGQSCTEYQQIVSSLPPSSCGC